MSVHDLWRGAKTGPGRRYEVRWREGGRQRKRRFTYRAVAERFDAERKLEPEIRNAREGRSLTVAGMMETWLATKAGKKPKTVEAAGFDAKEVTDTFGRRLANDLRPSEIREWSHRDRGAWVRKRSMAALRQAYKLAVADGLLAADPTAGIPLPSVPESDRRALTWVELERLATAAGERHAPLVWLLGTCGLRIEEACALTVADIGGSRLRVRQSKTGRARDVPILPFVREMLTLDQPGPLFRGERSHGRLNSGWWRRQVFERAAASAGLGAFVVAKVDGVRRESWEGITPHCMRHTAASLAIAAGADVKAVQRMLGHKSAVMTLDLYGHLFDEQLDTVADRMQTARENARTGGAAA